jgi:hypothetical protein
MPDDLATSNPGAALPSPNDPGAPASQTCANIWLRCQQEAEAIIAPDGKLIEDRSLRNQRISAAYASLWLRNNRFQWAGFAAFASKQVGCSMLNAVQIMDRSADEVGASGGSDSFTWAFKKMLPAVVHVGAGYLRGRLSLGNLSVFLDIYPLHRFYELHGLERLKACIGERQAIKDQVRWPVNDDVLPYGQPFRQIGDGFTLIERGDLPGSVRQLAFHEQVNVLQRVLYEDRLTRLALDANQFAWVSDIPGADFNEIQVTMAAQCAAKPSPVTTWFDRNPGVHLYNSGQRMEFVYRAAEQFDRLLNGKERGEIEYSLQEISAGHGVQ